MTSFCKCVPAGLILLLFSTACKTREASELSAQTSSEVKEFAQADKVSDVYWSTSQHNSLTESHYNTRTSKAYIIVAATFNVGLLSDSFSSVFDFDVTGAYVPHYETRRQHMKDEFKKLLNDKSPHFIALQELFYEDDINIFRDIASENGYGMLKSTTQAKKGTAILFRKKNLSSTSTQGKFARMPFSIELADEYVDRSIVGGVFLIDNNTESGIKVLVSSAHLSYALGKEENKNRLDQIAQMSAILRNKAQVFDVDAVILGADFNLSPIVGTHVYDTGSAVAIKQPILDLWQENTKGYVKFFNEMRDFRMLDTWFAANPLPSKWWESLTINDFDEGRSVSGFTEDPVVSYITRIGPTTKEEPAQRLDYVWFGTRERSGTNRYKTHVLGSELIFTQPLVDKNGKQIVIDNNQALHLSDHSGVMSRIAIFK